jgi:hypothetical protein
VAALNWEKARRRELVRDRGADPTVSRVKPIRDQPTGRKRKRRSRRRRQLELVAAKRSGWPAREHMREWVLREYGEELWAVVEEAMAKRAPA